MTFTNGAGHFWWESLVRRRLNRLASKLTARCSRNTIVLVLVVVLVLD
jgi:hypothetical protein